MSTNQCDGSWGHQGGAALSQASALRFTAIALRAAMPRRMGWDALMRYAVAQHVASYLVVLVRPMRKVEAGHIHASTQ